MQQITSLFSNGRKEKPQDDTTAFKPNQRLVKYNEEKEKQSKDKQDVETAVNQEQISVREDQNQVIEEHKKFGAAHGFLKSLSGMELNSMVDYQKSNPNADDDELLGIAKRNRRLAQEQQNMTQRY